jgi:hypothetical protein
VILVTLFDMVKTAFSAAAICGDGGCWVLRHPKNRQNVAVPKIESFKNSIL